MNKNLIILVGPPGSGKSTLRRKIVSTADETIVTINTDEQGRDRCMLIFTQALSKGLSIVVDRMNFNKEQRTRFLGPAKALGYTTKIIVLHENKEICLKRVLEREGHETINKGDDKSAQNALNVFFGKYERPEPGEADEIEFMYPDQFKPSAVVCDLDGTLCNTDARVHHVYKTPKDWKSFFAGIPDDPINSWCASLLTGMNQWARIVLASGRSDNLRPETVQWLDQHEVEYHHLFMRNRSDYRQDYIAKEIILDFEILTRYTPLFFIDDRKQVVDMWRRRGFVCLQCNEGDF